MNPSVRSAAQRVHSNLDLLRHITICIPPSDKRRLQDDILALTSHNWWEVITSFRYHTIRWDTYQRMDPTTPHQIALSNHVISIVRTHATSAYTYRDQFKELSAAKEKCPNLKTIVIKVPFGTFNGDVATASFSPGEKPRLHIEHDPDTYQSHLRDGNLVIDFKPPVAEGWEITSAVRTLHLTLDAFEYAQDWRQLEQTESIVALVRGDQRLRGLKDVVIPPVPLVELYFMEHNTEADEHRWSLDEITLVLESISRRLPGTSEYDHSQAFGVNITQNGRLQLAGLGEMLDQDFVKVTSLHCDVALNSPEEAEMISQWHPPYPLQSIHLSLSNSGTVGLLCLAAQLADVMDITGSLQTRFSSWNRPHSQDLTQVLRLFQRLPQSLRAYYRTYKFSKLGLRRPEDVLKLRALPDGRLPERSMQKAQAQYAAAVEQARHPERAEELWEKRGQRIKEEMRRDCEKFNKRGQRGYQSRRKLVNAGEDLPEFEFIPVVNPARDFEGFQALGEERARLRERAERAEAKVLDLEKQVRQLSKKAERRSARLRDDRVA